MFILVQDAYGISGGDISSHCRASRDDEAEFADNNRCSPMLCSAFGTLVCKPPCLLPTVGAVQLLVRRLCLLGGWVTHIATASNGPCPTNHGACGVSAQVPGQKVVSTATVHFLHCVLAICDACSEYLRRRV